jgi:hypothetical protein
MSDNIVVQEFTSDGLFDFDSITFEALEFWTDLGWEIVPAGYRFQFQRLPKVIKNLIRDNEIILFVFREYNLVMNNKPTSTIERQFRKFLIMNTQIKKRALKKGFMAKFKERLRIEFICLTLRVLNLYSRLLK